MDTISLCKLACGDKKIKHRFSGVYSADTLPHKRHAFSKYIVNLDSRNKKGSHWISVFFKNDIAYYFDSYGYPPSVKSILDFLNRNSRKIYFNRVCYQDDFTTTCGYFSLYFLYRMSRNQPLFGLSTQNKSANEKFINNFAKTKFKYSKCCYTHFLEYQHCQPLKNVYNHSIS